MKTGLVLIDIQNDYFPGGKMELVGIGEAGAKAVELLAFFREKGWPIFHVRHTFEGPGAPFFEAGSEGAEINEIVKPREGETVVEKHFPNSFRESTLLDELRTAGIERVVICGEMSHMCVDATTRAAADFGFPCLLAHDACATTDLEFGETKVPAAQVQASYMAALGWGYANVLTTDDLIAEISK